MFPDWFVRKPEVHHTFEANVQFMYYIREAAKKIFLSGPDTKRGWERGKCWPLRKKELIWKLENKKKSPKKCGH